MQVTINDYHKILGLMQMVKMRQKLPDVERLWTNLVKAKMISQVSIPRNIVTMNSKILLRDTESGRETTVVITYPHEADARVGKISVFSSIGVALLGSKEGETVSWIIPNGVGYFKIEKIIYQPEAAGDYHL